MLYQIDRILSDILCNENPFVGLVIVLVGDPAQLPPVGGNSLWVDISSGVDLVGYSLFTHFDDIIVLEENNRLDMNDPDAVIFDDFLMRLRDGKNTEDDWNLLRSKYSKFTMGFDEWKRRGFENEEALHLYCTNREVNNRNSQCIKALGTPIALVESENTGRRNSMSEDHFNGLRSLVFLAVGSHVLHTENFLNLGLANGSTGIVKDLVYKRGTGTPGLPEFVWVYFGTQYTGPPFFDE